MGVAPDLQVTLASIGANIHRLRIREGLTQDELARVADLDLRTVQRVERGTMHMRLGILLALAAALEVRPAELLRPARLKPARHGRPWHPR